MRKPEIRWAGPTPGPKTLRETADELAEITRLTEGFGDALYSAPWLENAPVALREAFGELGRCTSRAVPIFGLEFPPAELRKRLPEIVMILAALAEAELKLFTALAVARLEWLYGASRADASEAGGEK